MLFGWSIDNLILAVDHDLGRLEDFYRPTAYSPRRSLFGDGASQIQRKQVDDSTIDTGCQSYVVFDVKMSKNMDSILPVH